MICEHPLGCDQPATKVLRYPASGHTREAPRCVEHAATFLARLKIHRVVVDVMPISMWLASREAVA